MWSWIYHLDNVRSRSNYYAMDKWWGQATTMYIDKREIYTSYPNPRMYLSVF